jgi:hypothetical protein
MHNALVASVTRRRCVMVAPGVSIVAIGPLGAARRFVHGVAHSLQVIGTMCMGDGTHPRL